MASNLDQCQFEVDKCITLLCKPASSPPGCSVVRIRNLRFVLVVTRCRHPHLSSCCISDHSHFSQFLFLTTLVQTAISSCLDCQQMAPTWVLFRRYVFFSLPNSLQQLPFALRLKSEKFTPANCFKLILNLSPSSMTSLTYRASFFISLSSLSSVLLPSLRL